MNFQITTTADSKLSYTPCYKQFSICFTDLKNVHCFDKNKEWTQMNDDDAQRNIRYEDNQRICVVCAGLLEVCLEIGLALDTMFQIAYH